MNSNPNRTVACTVTACIHNCGCTEGSYCNKKDGIRIGTHEADPTAPECTDCLSFKHR